MARWSSAEYLKEKYPNAEYAQISQDNEIYQKIKSCIANVKERAENNRLLSLDGVVECDRGSHYIAFVSGGANGRGDWVEYLGTFQAIIEGLKEDGKAWLVELKNDCADDVHYALIGFRRLPSSKDADDHSEFQRIAMPRRNCDRFNSGDPSKDAADAWNAYDEWVASFEDKGETPPLNEFGWMFALAKESEATDGKESK